MKSEAHPQTVVTTLGPVTGYWEPEGQVYRYLGIPYAEPPLGQLRFKPPVLRQPWLEPLDAARFGPASLQVCDVHENIDEMTDDPNEARAGYFGSEDCLTLNVWSPGITGDKKPLFIWIHGGANHLEGSRSKMYDGAQLSRQGDLVYASMNYRLGPFGFMDVSEQGGEGYRGSSSNGLRDQLMAVEWIIANAEAFGADPDNVTIAGESAGGMNISWLIASGKLKGKIRRAIIMSNVKGPCGFGENAGGSRHDPSEARDVTRKFLQRVGYSDFQTLLAATGREIFARLAESVTPGEVLFDLDSMFYPCVDPSFAPLEPFRAVRAGALDGIDLMIGHTNYEAGLWILSDTDIDKHPPEWMTSRFGYLTEEVQRAACEVYPSFFPDAPSGELGLQIMSDCGFVCPTIWYAEEALAAGSRVWFYRFDWEVDDRLKAMHAAELPFFFGRSNDAAACRMIGPPRGPQEAAQRSELAKIFSSYVVSFARHGDPNSANEGGSIDWPSYDVVQRRTLCLAANISIQNDPASPRRQWWDERVYRPVMGDISHMADSGR